MSRFAAALVAFGWLTALLLQFRPIDDVDVFWQVRTGQRMLESSRVVLEDSFTFTHAGERVPPVAWLTQTLYAEIYRLGEWRALQFVHGLAFAAAFVVTGLTLRRSGVSLFSALLALAVGLEVALPHSSLRPQAFGLLGFATLLVLARSQLAGPVQVALAIPLLIVWQNLHPSVAVGAVALASLVAVRWVRYFRDRKNTKPFGITFLLVLTAVSQLATPLGWHILAVSRMNAVVSRDWLGVTEWLPPWNPSVRGALLTFWLALALSLLVLAYLRFRVDWEDLALFAVMTLLSLSAARFALFWAVALVPVWARWIEKAKPVGLFAWRGEGRLPLPAILTVVAAGLAIVWFGPSITGRPVFASELPMEGVAHLKEALPRGRIYNYREWGGPLIFAGSPEWRVAIDGRLYLFSFDEWTRYNEASRGTVSVAEIEELYRPDAFFLRPGFHDELISKLKQSAAWRQIYSDASCSIFLR